MFLNEFINKYNNQKIDFDGAYGAQCVDLFRYYCREVLELPIQPVGVKGAKDFWSNYDKDVVLQDAFDRIANTPEFVPIVGDVAVFYNETHGHISICTGENSDTKVFESFDQNYPYGSACKRVSHNYSNFYGALRPKAQEKIKAPVIRKSNEKIADEVIAMKWGVQPERQKLLEQAGYNYNEVQAIVNQKLNANKSNVVTKTVSNCSMLNLRTTAGYGNNVYKAVNAGTQVEYTGLENGWAKIKFDGKTLYCGKNYLV
ncbi:MAG: CHAP domain-containing protein [Clostridia bacterium]|nr:CHAP domain-containing protein [Clostridia bacterium]